jgi:hypothetical protein
MRRLLATLLLLAAPALAQVEHPPGDTLANLGTCDSDSEGLLKKVTNGDSKIDCNPTGTGDYTVDCACLETSASNYEWVAVISAVHDRPGCARFEDLAAADDNIELFMADFAVTVTGVSCHCAGTCTPTIATISLEDRAGNGMTHGGAVTCGSGTGDSSFTAVTAANTLNAGESVVFDVDNTPSPATDDYLICVTVEATNP